MPVLPVVSEPAVLLVLMIGAPIVRLPPPGDIDDKLARTARADGARAADGIVLASGIQETAAGLNVRELPASASTSLLVVSGDRQGVNGRSSQTGQTAAQIVVMARGCVTGRRQRLAVRGEAGDVTGSNAIARAGRKDGAGAAAESGRNHRGFRCYSRSWW